jgi:hypothetical protein
MLDEETRKKPLRLLAECRALVGNAQLAAKRASAKSCGARAKPKGDSVNFCKCGTPGLGQMIFKSAVAMDEKLRGLCDFYGQTLADLERLPAGSPRRKGVELRFIRLDSALQRQGVTIEKTDIDEQDPAQVSNLDGFSVKEIKAPRKRETFVVGDRTSEIAPLHGKWQIPFCTHLLNLRQAQNCQDQAAIRKLSEAVAMDADSDAFLAPATGAICASQDPDGAKAPEERVGFWAERASESLTRTQMLAVIEKQAALEQPLRDLQRIADEAIELAAKHSRTITKGGGE